MTYSSTMGFPNLVDDATGRYCRAGIRAAIKHLTNRRWMPKPFAQALPMVLYEALQQHMLVSERLRQKAEFDRRFAERETILERDAEQLAARYGYDVPRIRHQFDRRMSAGSTSMTLDGSSAECARFRRALATATAKRDAAREAAE